MCTSKLCTKPEMCMKDMNGDNFDFMLTTRLADTREAHYGSHQESSHREPQWECFALCPQSSGSVLSVCRPAKHKTTTSHFQELN